MAGGVSLEQKVSLLLLVIGAVLYAVSLIQPHWFSIGDSYYAGLWKHCTKNTSGNDVCVSYDGTPGWITGPEVLQCMGLSLAVCALGLSVKMLFRKTRITSLLASLSAALSGVLGVSGAEVYHKNEDKQADMAWCFYLNIVGDIFMFLAGAALLVHAVRLPRILRQNYETINKEPE